MKGSKTEYFGERIRKHQWVLLLMAVGVSISILLLCRFEPFVPPVKEIGDDWIRQLQTWNQKRYCFDVIRRRAVLPVLWYLCSSTGAGIGVLCLGWVYIGFSVGVFLAVLFHCVGVRAVLLCWGLTMPQYACYLPALFLIYLGCQMRWSGRRTGEYTHFVTQRQWSPQKKLYVLRMLLGTILYGAGLWCECVIHPKIVEKIFTKL